MKNIDKGFIRLTFVLSLLALIFIPLIVAIDLSHWKRHYNILTISTWENWDLIYTVRENISRLASISIVSFSSVWVFYGCARIVIAPTLIWIIKGFKDPANVIGKVKENSFSKNRLFLWLLFSILIMLGLILFLAPLTKKKNHHRAVRYQPRTTYRQNRYNERTIRHSNSQDYSDELEELEELRECRVRRKREARRVRDEIEFIRFELEDIRDQEEMRFIRSGNLINPRAEQLDDAIFELDMLELDRLD